MFIGHQKIVSLLNKSLKKRKIAQAYLFCGPESVGKFTLAQLFAESLISKKPEMNLTKLTAVENDGGEKENYKLAGKDGFRLDMIVVKPEIEINRKGILKEKEIKIEKIKEVQKELSSFPYRGEYKILIINNAHRMTESAQNALLKILEEPNRTSVIILVTHEEGKIIPTIHSRCQKLKFYLVPQGEIKKELSRTGDRADDEIIFLAMGRPGLATKIKAGSEEKLALGSAYQEIKSLPGLGINDRFRIAEELSRNIPETIKKLDFWVWILNKEASESQELAKSVKRIKLAGEIEKSTESLKNTSFNSRLILENLLLSI